MAQVIKSPEVSKEAEITFRLLAPKAKEVTVECSALKEKEMKKNSEGVWELKTSSLTPNFYDYSYIVDGVRMQDPQNPLQKYNLLKISSMVHVCGEKPQLWERTDSPRGVLHRHEFQSKFTGLECPYLVYTPPNYLSEKIEFPVLYLHHGFSDSEVAWTSVGMAHVIFDNLIAQKRMRPMIVVMPLGYGNNRVLEGGWKGISRNEIMRDSYDRFSKCLREEIIPQVEGDYRVKKNRKFRAIVGLSMGGGQSLMIGLNFSDVFSSVGAFSAGGMKEELATYFPRLSSTMNEQMDLVWLACGAQDFLIDHNRKLTKWLEKRGVAHTWKETEGSHNFIYWKNALIEFVPLLFKN